MATKDDEDQGHDKWGGVLQNEYGRILGRIESKQDEHSRQLAEIRSNQGERDKSARGLEERVRKYAHDANNVAQVLTSQVEVLKASTDTIKSQLENTNAELGGIKNRVADLEKPVNAAIAARDERRARFKKIWLYLAGAGVVLWPLFEPVYRAVTPIFVQRWFGTFPLH